MEHIQPDFNAPANFTSTAASDARERVQRTRGTLEVALHAASRLVERRRTDPRSAYAEVARALLDRFGSSAELLLGADEIDTIAARAVDIAQREIAVSRAAEQLMATDDFSMFEATLAVADHLGGTNFLGPYDSTTPEGRRIQRRWLAVAAWEAKVRAGQSNSDVDDAV